MTEINKEFIDGYSDGRDISCPEPSGNRHAAYRHSFAVARAELLNKPIPYAVSKARAEAIEAREVARE